MLGVGWVKEGSSHAAVLFSFHFVYLEYHQYFCTRLKNKCPAYQVEVTLIVPWWCKGVLVISVTLLLRIKIEQLHFLLLGGLVYT